MKYIQFDNSKLPNLEYSLFKEILQTNHAGAYMSTSITGCNTRKYHGLLVCPLKEFGGEDYVMLSSVQCSVIEHDKVFNLGVQEYKGEYFEPKGHKYMVEYSVAPASKMTYRIGGTVVSQQYILSSNENQVMIRYAVEEAPEPVTLRLKPFLAFRSIHELTHENMSVNTHYEEVDNGVKFCLYKGFPSLYLQGSKKMDFVAMPDWYRDVEYIKERYRGYGFQEDLYVPGFFEFKMKQGDVIVFSASLSEASSRGLKTKFTKELGLRPAKDSMKSLLENASQQFIYRDVDGKLMLRAGYHWKRPQLRDMFVSVAGLALFQPDRKAFDEIVKGSLPSLKKLYIDEATMNSTSIDVPLWFFYLVNECVKFYPKQIKPEAYFDLMRELVEFYWSGVPGKMHVTSEGLIYARSEGHPQTWMNAKTSYGLMVTPRYGCAVEVNALWYNAIATTLETAKKAKAKDFIEVWTPRLEQVGKAFLATFVNDKGYLFDYVDGDYRSWSVRPNQVIAASLKYSPLSKEQKKSVLDLATKELLTPRGLRSLSPNDGKYKGAVDGNEDERALAVHNGAAYPWLLSFYADLMLDVHKNSGISQLKRIVDNWEDELTEHGIGSISECYNGNPPYQAKGAISMAWNVAALQKLIKIIEPK